MPKQAKTPAEKKADDLAKAAAKAAYDAMSAEDKKAFRAAEKSANFVKLADGRMTKALDAIANIGGLSNKASYDYTTDQLNVISDALYDELEKTLKKFQPSNGAVASKAKFSLVAALASAKPDPKSEPEPDPKSDPEATTQPQA